MSFKFRPLTRRQIDIMHWFTRTALELISQSGLGHSFDSLAEGSDVHPYSTAAKQLMYVRTAFVTW